jgi:hypothetical protein
VAKSERQVIEGQKRHERKVSPWEESCSRTVIGVKFL